MYYGADYYPEHWPQERWETDARLMQEAGINLVRMGEFAWSLFERQQGCYNWDWLKHALDILGAHGISAVLGTPTAAPPAWLCDAYPEIMAVERNGHRVTCGERRQYCPTNPTYRKLSEGIVAAMAYQFADDPRVVAWQLDNEFGCHHPRCYCPDCRRAFQEWLQLRYGTLTELGEAWGTHFWSHDYTSWSQIPLPIDSNGVSNPCLELDYFRFASAQWVAYQHVQLETLRRIIPARQRITHNLMGFNFQEIDYFDLARELDFVSWDNYPIYQANDPAFIALNHATMRGLKDAPFWVMEEQAGPSGWQVMSRQPRPGQLRLWAYQAIAYGADAIVYFRWRTCRFNTEEYWHGILEHHGQPRRRYFEVQQMGKEIAKVGDRLIGAMPQKEAALIISYDDMRALRLQPGAQGLTYNELTSCYYRALHRLGIPTDVVSPDVDLSPYKLVIAPVLHLVTRKWVDNLTSYVNQGGTLWIGARSGVKDESNKVVDAPLPGLLADLCGIEVEEYDAIGRGNTCEIAFEASLTSAGNTGQRLTGHSWCDILSPHAETEILARFIDDYYAGKPAFTRTWRGRGSVYYAGFMAETGTLLPLVETVARAAGISPVMGLPEGVEISTRVRGVEQFTFMLNHNAMPREVAIAGEWKELLSGSSVSGSVLLPSYGVVILQPVASAAHIVDADQAS